MGTVLLPGRMAVVVVLLAVALVETPVDAEGSMHPAIPLLDESGISVLSSGKPISTMRTCGGCHESQYIAEHSYHVSGTRLEDPREGGPERGANGGWFGQWNPLLYRRLTRPEDRRLDLGTAEWLQTWGWRHVGGGPAVTGQGRHQLDQLFAFPESPVEGIQPDLHVLDAATGEARAWDWASSGIVEMNCFLCHTRDPDNQARCEELADGHFRWANTATLAKTGIAKKTSEGWQYAPEAFLEQGEVAAERLGISATRSEHCGQCHGQTDFGQQPLQLNLSIRAWSTATKGQVFSPQHMSDSAINLQDKSQLTRPWDVHAAAMLECGSCHFSLNDPRSYEPTRRGRPDHLRYEPRRLAIGDFLQRPSHQFAKGHTSQGTVARHLDGTMRGCRECHRTEDTHRWLPYAEVHFARLSCEVCHIAQVQAPAIRQIDWTLLAPDGGPQTQWRGVEGDPHDSTSLVTGYRPVLLPRAELDGSQRLVPHNLISAWYWIDQENESQPVRLTDLQAALLVDGEYHAELQSAFDEDQDGRISDAERELDRPEKIEAVRRRLIAVGVQSPEIRGEILPFELHHGVGPASTATRDCETCHARDSGLAETMLLASYAPGGILPQLASDHLVVTPLDAQLDSQGRVVLRTDPREAGLYVLGHHHWSWLTILGSLSLISVALAITVHTGLRFRAHHTSGKERVPPIEPDANQGTH